MASLTFDFDGELSEDWVSQPRSSDGDVSHKEEVASNKEGDFRSSVPHSRIPRLTKPAAVNKHKRGNESSERPSPRPFHTKSKSELNIPSGFNVKERAISPISKGTPKTKPTHKRSSSVQSWTADGPVQHFGSEIRHHGATAAITPEWKKKLLYNQEVYDGKDLFSPVGIESAFRPPSAQKPVANAPLQRRRQLARTRAESSTIYPSSPPPYPSTSRRRTVTKSTSPSPLREHAPHDQCTGQGGKCEGATRTPTPTQRRIRMKSSKEEGAKGRRGSAQLYGAAGPENSSGVADHESISPVTISRGRIDYRTIQASILQLRDKMEELGIQDQRRPSSRSSDHGISYGTSVKHSQKALDKENLSREWSDGSDVLPRTDSAGRQWEGFSSDDNFYRKPLSPSSFYVNQGLSELKSDLPIIDRRLTKSPDQLDRLSKSSPGKPKSGGSPLKLFRDHDTFTNNHLMRRLSQYNGAARNRSTRSSSPPSPSPRRRILPNVPPDEASDSQKFGKGELNSYPFSAQDAILDENPPSESGDEEPSLPPVLPPKDPVKFRIPSGAGLDPAKRVSRALSKRLSNSYSSHRLPRRPSLAEFRRIVDGSDITSDGKRTIFSPDKSHQAKRRKTLLSSIGSPDNSPASRAYPLVIGKKRKDTLPPDEASYLNEKSLASRKILRPRSVSPQQKNSPISSMSSWLGVASSRQASHQGTISNGLDQSTKILAEDLANFALNVAQSITKGERKASVTTADFFKEANYIMQHLRGQSNHSSGRNSGDVSTVEPLPEIVEQDEPASREQTRRFTGHGHSKEEPNAPYLENALSKLNKFKEEEDPAFLLNESIRNLHASSGDTFENEKLPASDPHIRIIGTGTSPDDPVRQCNEDQIRTRSSAGQSTTRSLRTGSSSNSSKKFNIAPETVKDILSDHVGRMIFDHDKGIWIRNRTESADKRPGSAHMSSDFTEEDPLKSIPDLEENEIPGSTHYRKNSASSGHNSDATVITRNRGGGSMQQEADQSTQDHHQSNRSRPSSGHGADSSQLSKYSKFGSSQAAPETRATSWSTVPSKTHNAAAEPELTQVEEARETPTETSSLANRESSLQVNVSKPKPSAVMFSSPLTTLPDEAFFEKARARQSSSAQGTNDSDSLAHPVLSSQNTPSRQNRIASTLARNRDRAKRHLSVVKQRYSDRPVSRIDENDEHIGLNGSKNASPEASLALITPQNNQSTNFKVLSVPPPTSDRHSSVAFHKSFHLDALSEFTIHQADESLNLDVNYVRQRHNLLSDAEVDSHFSLAVRDLVARVTDIEPFEPYWEYISRLEIPSKKLMTLHMLEDFCPRIEELDVDNNELGQLNGVPETLMTLSARGNCLSSVTAWGHLRSLHYLDASNNQIKSLKGLEGLVHLRELALNNNHIDSLHGIESLPGLIKLNLRGNKIKNVALSGFQLTRLTELDLSSNEISSFSGIECFQGLERLHLQNNYLKSISFGKEPRTLTIVDLSKNYLDSLDVSTLVGLKHLNVDGNSLCNITGLDCLHELHSLSWRAQNISTSRGLAWTDALEVHELALSGNKLDIHLLASSSFLNLRCLDLSCCGIENLPTNFGRMMPNLRYLNLNYNGLRDARPLVGVSRLEELHIAGNRINRLRNTASVLEKIGNSLQVLDMRMNAITLGFYASNGGFSSSSSKPTEGQMTKAGSMSEACDVSLRDGERQWRLVRTNVMSAGQVSLDQAHLDRLEESTAMRRRVYELLVVHNCPRITKLDGLKICESSIDLDKDHIWTRLVELKVVRMELEAPKA